MEIPVLSRTWKSFNVVAVKKSQQIKDVGGAHAKVWFNCKRTRHRVGRVLGVLFKFQDTLR
jgi:hypothetical protein